MEKVKVLKNVTGLFKKGDILVSSDEGADFKLDLVVEKDGRKEERHTRVDCLTVYRNIPSLFDWVIDYEEDTVEKGEPLETFKIVRSEREIADRVEFFRSQLETFRSDEESTVYNNLLWFVDWLTGKAELLK